MGFGFANRNPMAELRGVGWLCGVPGFPGDSCAGQHPGMWLPHVPCMNPCRPRYEAGVPR